MRPSTILKVSRLESLTDGIFAIAMTILVLDLRLPRGTPNADLAFVIVHDVIFRIAVYIGSFAILGTLWIAMNFQIGLIERVNRVYLWANVFYLMLVCVVPFSATLLAAYPFNAISMMFYGTNLLCAMLVQFLIAEVANRYDLNRDIYTPQLRWAILKRIFLAPCFYLLAILLANVHNGLAFVALITPTVLYLFPGKVDQFD